MDDDFRILFDYVEQMKRELQDEADLQSKSAEDEEKKCVHESIETEEAYVCCKCGLVLEDIFQPDIHWCDHALMPRIYGGADRLNAMHKVLIKFLDKISFCTYLPMYTLEERLRNMKIDSGFKSLNYAICVMCILEGDQQAEEQIRPHLPRSDVAWARSLHLLSPVPEIFVRNWLRNLLKPTGRDLSDRQKKRRVMNNKKKKTSRSTRHRHRPDVDRQDTLLWIASFPGTAPDHNQHFSGNWLYPMTLSKCWPIVCFDAELCPYGTL